MVTFPNSDRILVFWRRGAHGWQTDAIMVASSFNGGQSFTFPRVWAKVCPFDQGTSPTRFRVLGVPSVTADKDRAYVVWSERRDPETGSCRAMTAR